ncbi:MAG: hypothetical protein HC880_12850, partial [Bacteroidia bacterium]|nr:hypothetical protein [Bacteroidia bacterium]
MIKITSNHLTKLFLWIIGPGLLSGLDVWAHPPTHPVERANVHHLQADFRIPPLTDGSIPWFTAHSRRLPARPLWSPLRMDSTELVADLQISSLSLSPDSLLRGDTLLVSFSVQNNGLAQINTGNWLDRLYLSSQPEWDINQARLLAEDIRDQTLAIGNAYDTRIPIKIPADIPPDLYYLYLLTDANNQLIEGREGEVNNILRSTPIRVVNHPDLQILSLVSARDSLLRGDTLAVSYVIQNNSPTATSSGAWRNRLYLSRQPEWDSTQVILLREVNRNQPLDGGASYAENPIVTIPPAIPPDFYYLYLMIDVGNQVREDSLGERNNILRSGPIQITRLPPDLQVSNIEISEDSLNRNQKFTLSFRVRNEGHQRTSDSTWLDRVYVSYLPQWNPQRAVFLDSLLQQQYLDSAQFYEVTRELRLPSTFTRGTYYLYLVIDAKNQVEEPQGGENNNLVRSIPIFLNGIDPVDMVLSPILLPITATAGQFINLQWRVDNQGNPDELVKLWEDAVYLSLDTLWSPATDTLLGVWKQFNPFNADNFYIENRDFRLPYEVSGDYYLFIVADHENLNNDFNLRDNQLTNRNENGQPIPLQITRLPYPDLAVRNPVATTALAGQSAQFRWETQNLAPVAPIPAPG